MYGYIYLTKNKVTGKIYVGQKKSNVFLGEKYLGSGKALKKAIQSYGKESFSVELIEEIDDETLMDKRETYWISFYKATNRSVGYNISEGGNVNRTMRGENHPFFGKTLSQSHRKNISLFHADIRGERNPFYGKQHTEESKTKIKENAKVNPNYGMRGKEVKASTRKALSQSQKEYWSDEENRMKRKEQTKVLWQDEEYRQKHIQAMRGKMKTIRYKECEYCGRQISANNYLRHTTKCTRRCQI